MTTTGTSSDLDPATPTAPAAPTRTEPAPLAYHRLAHLEPRTARWWRPVATLGVATGLLLALVAVLAVVLVVAVVASVVSPGLLADLAPVLRPLQPSVDLDDPRNPVDLLLGLGSIAVLLPVVVLAVRWGGGRRGTVHSVVGRFRWSLALRAAAVVLPAYAAVLWGLTAVAPPEDLSVPPLDAALVAVVVVALLLTPLQCAAEEYVFRGLPQQLLGTWLRRPVWGVVLPVPLFVASHGYDWVGQVDVAVFALATGFLVWKSGGLELAVVLHTAGNLPLFLASPLSPGSLQQGAVDPRALLVSLPLTLLTTGALTLWVSRTHGVGLLEPVRGHGYAHAHPATETVPAVAGPAPDALA
ncbi:CPBP family intramembrane glutamic endopeptidase [Pseudokineococcus basanitobsidens]|uniref:CPBP family intramembrane glutamic endopeptidase n=1 Tax=Pseudokineococcus basanitobsidens TaxID=1926649 RepID=A0ABU8RG52_9ACTN